MRPKYILSIFVLSLCFNLQGQNVKEAIQNSKQIAEGKKNLERDIKELEAFKAKLAVLDTAFETRNSERSNEVKANIVKDMIREVGQSGEKAKKARKEIAQSSAEVRSERREIREDREDSDHGGYDRRDDERDLARDKANARDDRRDRRDDIRDFQGQIDRAEKQASILEKLKEYSFSFEDADMEKAVAQKALLLEFKTSLEQDVEATKRELNEDIRESREDRRERRDDRNERDEYDTKRKRKRRW
ncbi:hypothetical protein [Poritiphilus flavus]|uniref:Uncharacterized protein n=1 Tax=Poritiphilus flavus TaxID=2697053 RepID=A0A6L9E9Z0_9FLAO|nr:hypothetical protein [Poritiphilus flavus]NAS11484.1 hypothetical protein [Poritiphilus flavus]